MSGVSLNKMNGLFCRGRSVSVQSKNERFQLSKREWLTDSIFAFVSSTWGLPPSFYTPSLDVNVSKFIPSNWSDRFCQ
jgi:hypothetical protein